MNARLWAGLGLALALPTLACEGGAVRLWSWPQAASTAQLHLHPGDLLLISLPQADQLYWLDQPEPQAEPAVQALRDSAQQTQLQALHLSERHANDLVYRAVAAGEAHIDFKAYALQSHPLSQEPPPRLHLHLYIDPLPAPVPAAPAPAAHHFWFWPQRKAAPAPGPCAAAATDH